MHLQLLDKMADEGTLVVVAHFTIWAREKWDLGRTFKAEKTTRNFQ